MKTYDFVMDVISRYLGTKDYILKVIEKIENQIGGGNVAFYPCSRYANTIVKEIKLTKPALFSKIAAFFDKSDGAKSDTGVNVYKLEKLSKMRKDISVIVIAHNTFYDKATEELQMIANYNGKLIKTSYFDFSLPHKSRDEILCDIKNVYNLLEDEKSKAVYLVTWLSRVFNDAGITYLFESEDDWKIDGKTTIYKNYKIQDLGRVCAQELYSEIYKMRFVYPRQGEYVFDIGAYKGDSAFFFADSVGPAGKVFAFEPTSQNFRVLVDNISLNNLSGIICPVNKGLSDKSGTMKAFTLEGGVPLSFISQDCGNENVQITTIDEFVEEQNLKKVDFIKMDVEGFESKVIAGGQKTIRKFTPKLAIPLYHQTSDLTELPLMVSEMADYKFYIRCKIEGPFSVTMYCIKK
jgi:FkbM family methyltransferase